MSARLKLKKKNSLIKALMNSVNIAEENLISLERFIKSNTCFLYVQKDVEPLYVLKGGKEYLDYIAHSISRALAEEYCKCIEDYVKKELGPIEKGDLQPGEFIRVEFKVTKPTPKNLNIVRRKKWF